MPRSTHRFCNRQRLVCPLLTAFEDRLIDAISARRDNPATALATFDSLL